MTQEEKSAYAKAYYRRTKTKKFGISNWAKANPDKVRECNKRYRAANKEKLKAYNKQWAQNNAGKVTAYARAYQLAKQRAAPKWLTTEQWLKIEEFYVNRPDGYHVDHIVPLKGKNVSGLHVPWNLQYLRAAENIAKSNKI